MAILLFTDSLINHDFLAQINNAYLITDQYVSVLIGRLVDIVLSACIFNIYVGSPYLRNT